MSGKLWQALEQVGSRYRRVRLFGGLAVCWLMLGLVCGVIAVVQETSGAVWAAGTWHLSVLVAAASLLGILCAGVALRSARDRRWVARRIEKRHRDLRAELLAAVDEVEATPEGRLGFLQETVVREALAHRRTHDWNETVPTWVLRTVKLGHAAALTALLVVVSALVFQARSSAYSHPRFGSRVDPSEVSVDPGDTELERGSALLVIARWNSSAPPEASLVLEAADRDASRRVMTRSLEDPTFAARVENMQTDAAYRVEFDGRSTQTYHVRIFEYPELVRADAHLVFPAYTSLQPKIVEDIRHVTAVEGTALTLRCRLNKDAASANLVAGEGDSIALAALETAPHTYQASMTLAESKRYKVQLVDREGRTNQADAEIVINVTRNRPPLITMTQPAHDVDVSPLEELKLRAQVEDDFGVVRHGLSYTIAGREAEDLVLAAPAGAAPATAPPGPAKKLAASHLIDFEALRAAPDQLITYFFWAEDVGPDGQTRRTSGDMFFAEVRPFDEIFRQGEQPAGGADENQGDQEGNMQEADRVIELQKQIINGTWKLIRRETRSRPTDAFAGDSKTLQESQHAVIEQTGPMGQQLRSEASKADLEQGVKFMQDAEKHLAQAAKNGSIPALGPALAAEQAAYQALLKLRAREFNVVRGARQRARANRGGSRSQRQLQQLELSPDENRYEEQRTARSQEERMSQREREQAENRQVLNRLRELAQRQTDLNARLKELQSALEAARTTEAREEIERQLKRLREQQQEILRDTDELRERMEREENQERMAAARSQIEQSRDHVRNASEALDQGRLPQAVTEGARAGRQLSELREQLRKDTSNRFSEEMTDLRNQARRLDEDQKKISDQLDAWNDGAQHSLRDSEERKQVRQGVEQQGRRLDQIMDRMRNTTQQAEETEPLLARGLYDTVRKATEQKIPDALKATQQLVEFGIADEAAKAARHAGKGIEQLRQGVERAAQSVLGDDIAALKRAQGELDDLADQVSREIDRATGRQPRDGQSKNASGRRQTTRPESDASRPPGDTAQQGETGRESDANPERDMPADPSGARGGRPQERTAEQRGLRGQQQKRQDGEQQGQASRDGAPNNDRNRPDQDGQPGRQQGQGSEQGQAGQRDQAGPEQGSRGQQGQPGAEGRQGGPQQGGGRGGRRTDLALDQVAEGLERGPGGPITGEGFRQWSDRMRDVEELLDDPEWRAEAARIRDRVRGAREEFRRHAKEPDWTQLQTLVAQPIVELRNRIAEEIRRRESPDALVPIDRDPVPPQFAEGVRRYYERLGSGQ
jgi:hypothetical protein